MAWLQQLHGLVRQFGFHCMAEQQQTRGFTLWDLLTLISFVMPITGAFGVAKDSHAGVWGYILVILVGLAIGVGCAVCMRIALVRVGGFLVRNTVSKWAESSYGGMMLITAFVWIVFALFAGRWLASTILSLLLMKSV